MGRVREDEAGGCARLVATAATSAVLLVGILGFLGAAGSLANPGAGFGVPGGVLRRDAGGTRGAGAPTASLGAAFPEDEDARARSRDEGAAWRNGASGVNTNVRRRNRPEEDAAPGSARDATGGAAEDFPAAAWDSRGRKHAWLADYGAGAHLDSIEWEDLPEGPDALQPRAAHEAWASDEDDDVNPAAHEGDVDADDDAYEDDLLAAARDPFRPDLGAAPEDDPAPPRSGRRRSHPDEAAARGHDARGDDLVAGPGSMTLNELRSQLSGDVTTDFTWSGSRLPELGQDVATGERRERGRGSKSSSKRGKRSKAGRGGDDGEGGDGAETDANEKTIDVNDLSWYDPAFVDSELEYRTRSGHKRLVEEFLNPPALNYTADTGRLRRLGRTLYLDGKPWLMRALCYSPVPVGWDPDWFEPYGDFFTSEYAGIYERDIPLIAAAGVNALRIYTLKFSHRHTHFFDLCRRYGIEIIVGYDFEDGTKSFFNDEVSMYKMQTKIRALLRAARHPAVVAWIIGNELNGPWNLYVCDKDLAENFGISGCQFDNSIEKLMKSINLLCSVVKEEGIMCGTALANVNLPISKQHLVGMQLWGAAAWIKIADRYMTNLDFWGVNLYTRRYFSPMGLFQRFHMVSKKPMIISEYGVDAYSLSPQLEGWNAYDTMGTEDEVSQADWLITMVEDLERHSTTCAAGCANRFISGGAIMSWVDEYWKGKAVTPVPTTDERIPTITRVCPSLKEYLHSPCGYASPTQPDLYVSEEWFGIMAVRKRCSINKVDLLRPRAAYFMLKLIWGEGGSCTPFLGQDPEKMPYDPEKHLNCGRAMKSYIMRTMDTFMRAEAEAFHQIKLSPSKPVPIFAHFENFSVQLNHPKGVINPVSSTLQSTFLTCHAQAQIHKRSPQTCPAAPKVMEDVVGYITKASSEFVQPGDTSCPQQEQINAMKLEVQLKTVFTLFVALYIFVAMLLKRKALSRMTRDAMISLVRAGMPGARYFVNAPSPDEALAKVNATNLLEIKPPKGKAFATELYAEAPADPNLDAVYGEELRLSRPGPAPTGASDIEKGIEAWRRRLTPVVNTLGPMFGFQSAANNASAADAPESTQELVVERMAKILWNMTQLEESPAEVRGAACAEGIVANFAVNKLHVQTFAGYDRWVEHTKFGDLAPKGARTTLAAMHGADAARRQPQGGKFIDTQINQIALFELLYTEAANCRLLPEMLSFTYHAAAHSVEAPTSADGVSRAAAGAGLPLPPGDFVESIVTPFHGAIVESMNLGKRLYTRVGYDDINETFWNKANVEKMLTMEAMGGASSGYAKYRQFLRSAGAATERDQRLAAVFQKTFREHYGWGMVFCNFHRMFTFLSIALHLLVVHAFTGFQRPALFASAAVTAAFCQLVLEMHALFIHGHETLWSRRVSFIRAGVASAHLIGAGLCVGGFVGETAFCVLCVPYFVFASLEIAGYYPLGAPKTDHELLGKKSRGDLDVDDPADKRAYRLFWCVVLLIKFAMDYVLIVHALVAPSRAIMQIDLYCWNYNFAGEDCDQYDYTDALPVVLIQSMRLFRRYAYKFLMLFERWLPNVLLYYCNTFFFYLAALGFASAFDRLRWRGVADGWSKVVRTLPAKVDAFQRLILSRDVRPPPERSPSTAFCVEAVSEGWNAFARSWNEVVRSLRDRDLLSNEEVSLLVFQRLKGAAVDAFFGGVVSAGNGEAYLLFPAMLAAPVFTKSGASRNVNMTYSMLDAVMAQVTDVFAFIFVSVLGVCETTHRATLAVTLKSMFDLIGCAVVRRQASAADDLTALRGHFILVFTAIRAAAADQRSELAAEHIAAARRSIDAALNLVVETLANDRDLEDDAGKEANRLLRGVVDRIREIVVLEKLEQPAHVQTRVLPAIVTLPARTAVDHSLTLLSTANPAAEPASNEAREVLRFFLESFTDPQLGRGSPVRRMPSMVTLTPLYKEEVTYTAEDLSQRVDGENVSTLRFIISMLPTEWRSMLQRTKLNLPQQDYEKLLEELHNGVAGDRKIGNGTVPTRRLTDEDRRLLREICTWASGRSQTMFRTARGFAAYADATRVLARLEGVPETDIEALVEAKFSHVVCAQVYGSEGNEEKDEQLEDILREFPHMSIVTAAAELEGELESGEDGKKDNRRVSWFLSRRSATRDGAIVQTHRVKLPGHAIVGEGKPENQNLGMAFVTGMYVQTIDMNQDCQLAEALKARNVLAQFTGKTRLVGFPEQMITDQSGSVASFAALSEQVFGTIVQRYMAKPLCVRFHYGHPDVWDYTWVRGQGGVSKASRQLHLSEDIFGGMNLVLRGGRVKYVGFKMVGKAREVSFDGTNQFNFKISSGNGMQLISRDFHRLGKHFDVFRMMSFFQSSAGIFFTEWMLFASLSTYVVCKLLITMLHVETFFGDGDAFDSVGFHEEVGLELLYPSQWMIQASLVMAWPSMLEGWLDGGLVKMFQRFYQHSLSGAHIFNMFIAKTRGFAIDHTVLSGKAIYKVTRRGMQMQSSFVSLYTRYASSHITPSMSMAALSVLITLISRYNAQYTFVMTTWHVWFAILCLCLSPWFFHPQSFKEGEVYQGFVEWACWIDFGIERYANDRSTGVPGLQDVGSWSTWNYERLKALRGMPANAKFDYIVYRILPVPVVLLFGACAAVEVDDIISKPTLRGIVILTSGVAGILLSVIYYMATSPSFLWPRRLLNIAMRMMPQLTVVERHLVVLLYGVLAKIGVLIFHHLLCAHLFMDSIDSTTGKNRAMYFCAAFFLVTILVCTTSIIGDNPPPMIRPMAIALRNYSDAMLREVDVIQGLLLHAFLQFISLFPISYIHGKILFNRAYAAVLGTEMRRRRVISLINMATAQKSLRENYLRLRNFVRRVLGLRAVAIKFARPTPTAVPHLDADLTKPGKFEGNPRRERIAARIRPIAENIAVQFGFQRRCLDSTFTDEPVEVASNLGNSVEALSHWLCNAMDLRENIVDGRETESQFRDVIADLHAHLFQNYLHWGEYTGMLEQAKESARSADRWTDEDGGERRVVLVAFMAADNDAMWDKNNRDQSISVMSNAHLHHLCLWFLLYGESANLRHTSEVMCYIFHAAMCSLVLEDKSPAPCPLDGREPTGDQLVLARPVPGSEMPYPEDDYLDSFVRPLYAFLQREVQGRATAAIVNRVMYDDVNEFFWLQERFKVMMPPEDGYAGADEPGWIGVSESMRGLPVEARIYAHTRAFLRAAAAAPGGAGEALSKVFFKTHREVAGWMSMFVNFNTIFLFHAVAFHVSMAYVFAHGWNWEYISTATITHAVIKFTAELATLHFRNLSKDSNSDWAVMATRTGAFASVPIFYCLEYFSNDEGRTPYFQALALVYAVAFAGVATSSVRREPYMGGTQQLAVPFRERIIYTLFWIVVLSVKLTFGHFLLVKPLREALMALQHPDLCWNKESDEYTSCINLEGDALMNALRFTPKKEYFMLEKKTEEDYEDFEDALEYEPIDLMAESGSDDLDKVVRGTGGGGGSSRRPERLKARRRSLLAGGNPRLGGGNAYAPVAGGGVVKYSWENPAPVEDVRVSDTEVWRVPRAVAADMAYRGHASVSYEAMRNCNVAYGGEGWGGSSCEASPDAPAFDVENKLELPALGYIGEEIEGEIPEAYYDVHASVELMWIMTVIRALPAVTTYFCDTFLWYTFFATLFTVFLQWRGKVTHAQNWAFMLRTFASIPGLFCEKLLNREWPKPDIVHGDSRFGASGGSGSSGDSDGGRAGHGSTGTMDPLSNMQLLNLGGSQPRNRSGGGYGAEGPQDFVIELPAEMADIENSGSASGADPVDFLPEAMDIKWQHFARAWNSIVSDLRARDHISDAERDDLCYVFLTGRDVEQIFDSPEYVVMPPMMTSPVFSTTSLNTGRMTAYASFRRTLVQTKDLLCVLLTEVLGVVRPRDMHTLMRLMVELARVESEQMSRRRMDDISGYVNLREAAARVLMAVQSLAAETTATPAPEPDEPDEPDDRRDFSDESDEDDVDIDSLAGLTEEEREAKRRRRHRRERRRKKRLIKEAEAAREEKLVEAINLEMKYGCTGFLSKSTRKTIKKRGGPLLGCFVVDEDLVGAAARRREELRLIERAERRERGLPSDDDDEDDDGAPGGSRRRRRRRYRRGRRQERQWNAIDAPDDLMEVHGERIESALHDALLAVRELCSFALEQDGRWSSVNNQRKYRISQLYSSLLDTIRMDALRDPEHLRKVAAAATTPLARATCACLLRAFHSSNPGGQPRSEEAQRQLMFFCNSLRFTSLKTPSPLAQVRSWTAFTPYYAEDVKYRLDELTKPLEDEKTLFSLIVATFQADYDNFKERIGVLGADDETILRDHWKEVQAWASDRTQSLSRCVRGVCLYGSALRLLARLEGHDDEATERLVRSKFEFLVSAQIFGKQRSAEPESIDRFKANAIEELIQEFTDLKVCFVHVPTNPKEEDFASCLIGRDPETGRCRVDFRVKLPGNPIIGEGKPENQNQAVIYARGAYLQTLDMNQDNYMGESYKMRNLLDCFHSDIVLVGFPETIFSETHGAVAQFAAIAEFIFQTFQRFMTWPLMVRFHYGHPDVWDKGFTMTNGGVSKASKMLHVAEDFFGGVNAIARGGKVIFEEFIECGKGRDMGFTSVNGFEQKISGSSGTISMSRDLFRLHRGMDSFRIFSLFFSGPGFFISMMQTAWCVYLYIVAHATLAVADLEIYRVYRYFKMTETQTSLSLSKEEGGYYNSIYALQLGLLTILPLFLKMTIDRGVRDGISYTLSTLIQGSWAFNVFTMGTKGYNYMRALIFGQAQYIGTERGYVLQNASMVVLYGLYAKSHLYQGMELLLYLVLFHAHTSLPKSWLYSWSVWMFAGSVVISPWWFSPQATNLFWMQNSWMDWRRWIDGNFPNPKVSHGSWNNWHAHMISNWREMLSPWYKMTVVFTSGIGRIILALVCIASMHGDSQIEGVPQISQFSVNALRMSVACFTMMVGCVLYYIALRSKALARGPWLAFPEHLWKLSVYRGIVRVMIVLMWLGFYAVFMYDAVEGVSSSRTLVMTAMGCVAIISCVIEMWVMIGRRDIDHGFDFLMPPPDPPDAAEPLPRTWRHRYAKPAVLFYRGWLVRLRNFADFWYCEMDKMCGAIIFGILFVMSLLPIASMQAVLIWNETFSDVMNRRVQVQECVTDIID